MKLSLQAKALQGKDGSGFGVQSSWDKDPSDHWDEAIVWSLVYLITKKEEHGNNNKKKSVVNCKNSIITIKSECIHFSQENQVNYSLKTSSKLKLGACTMALWRKLIAAPAEDLSWVPSANTECPNNSLYLQLQGILRLQRQPN